MPGPGSQINSLMDMMQPPAPPPDTTLNFVGLPPGFATMAGGGGMAPGGMGIGGTTGGAVPTDPRAMPFMEGAPWGMTRADFESPLAYMGGGPFVPPPPGQNEWTPRDTGGWFTLGQLYDFAPGGARTAPQIGAPGAPRTAANPSGQQLMNRPPGGNVPGIFQHGSDAPSTNNWQLLGMGPGWIMRNGMPIQVGQAARRGFAGSGAPTSLSAEHGLGVESANVVAPGNALGGSNVWNAMYWPGGQPWGMTAWPAGTSV